ncbi:MAG: TonB-dependent receptor [Acidobacteria bacterium]|jgi:outer membrane receptor for ferrienterochelin and colicins|nr:TonB-dependent receptor [Bryobacteraceae bacterium CoA2 C42]
MRTVLLLAAASAVLAQGTRLEIRTKDGSGSIASGLAVRAQHRATGAHKSCTTDSLGVCDLELGAGFYLITASNQDLEGRAELNLTEPRQALQVTLQPRSMRTSVTVVSASRTEELQEESPTKVEAVTREQMLNTGYERVSDALQEIPGVLVRRGSTSTVGGEQIQGIDSRQVLVLQDGLPIVGARGIKSGAVNLNRQTSDRLARVEVAKGSGSSTYGSDAMGGVINMITREPSSPFEAGVSASGGSLGMVDVRGDLGGRRGPVSYFVNLGESRLDSYQLIPGSPTTVGPDTQRRDGLAKIRYQFHPKLALGFTANAYHNRDRGRNASETGPVSGVSNDSTQTFALVADLVLDHATTLQARGYSARYDENNLTTPLGRPEPPSPSNLNERLKRLDATLSRQVDGAHFVQGGVEWSQNLYRGANRLVGDNVGQQVTSTDTWLQDKWSVNRWLTLTMGGRVTAHSLFGNAAVPKAGAIVKLSNNWILRGSFGLGFRAPDLGQLYFRFANPANFYQVIGNPTLKPEHSRTFQAGALYRHRRYRAGVTLFRNDIRDLIDSRLTGTPRSATELNAILTSYGIPAFFDPLLGRQTFVYVNQARIFTQGVELDGEFAFNRNLRLSGAYTFLNALDRNTRLGLPQRHRHHGQTRLDYAIPRWGVNANLRGSFYSHWLLNAVTGTRGLPFQIWDAFAAKDLRRGIQTFVAIDNLNNSRDGKLQLTPASFDRPDYGRTFRLGLRYRFRQDQ